MPGIRNQQRTSYMRLVDYVEDKIEQDNPQGEGFYYVYTPAQAASTWTIPHSFMRTPVVKVLDESGLEMDADVYSSSTQVVITHAEPMLGSAVLIA